MAIAVVNHAALVAFANSKGFPLYTKVKCESGLNGYHLWDRWIRENVEYVIETAFDPKVHVKITESAQLIGELKNPWELRCQKFLEGTPEFNSFTEVVDTINAEGIRETINVGTHVNRAAIQIAVSSAFFKYKVDYEEDENGVVVTHNSLNVAIFNDPADSSLSYQSEIEVAQLWTTRVLVSETVNEQGIPDYIYEKRAYADRPDIEESYPWITIGLLNEAEYALWVQNNQVQEYSLEDGPMDIMAIDENRPKVTSRAKHASIFGNDTPHASVGIDEVAPIRSMASTLKLAAAMAETTQSRTPYPQADDSAVSGDM